MNFLFSATSIELGGGGGESPEVTRSDSSYMCLSLIFYCSLNNSESVYFTDSIVLLDSNKHDCFLQSFESMDLPR